MLEAYLHDPDVVDAMAKAGRQKPSPPQIFGWTPVLSALKDIQDQLIASRGGKRFVPRPEIPGMKEMWRRKDSALASTVANICGTD